MRVIERKEIKIEEKEYEKDIRDVVKKRKVKEERSAKRKNS